MYRKIFFVEDNDTKFDEVCLVLGELFPSHWQVSRASNMVDAESMLFAESWDVYLLDVSMDVTAGKAAFGLQSQATLGGLKLANTIAIEGLEKPTVIITGFDAFSNIPQGKKVNHVMDLNHVDQSAKAVLGDCYLGAVRYGADTWRQDLARVLKEVSFQWKF